MITLGTSSRSNTLNCVVGCNTTVRNMNYNCTDFSVNDDWSAGQGTYTTSVFSGLQYFEAT